MKHPLLLLCLAFAIALGGVALQASAQSVSTSADTVKSKEAQFGAFMRKIVSKPTRRDFVQRARAAMPSANTFAEYHEDLRKSQERKTAQEVKARNTLNTFHTGPDRPRRLSRQAVNETSYIKALQEGSHSCSVFSGVRRSRCMYEEQGMK